MDRNLRARLYVTASLKCLPKYLASQRLPQTPFQIHIHKYLTTRPYLGTCMYVLRQDKRSINEIPLYT